MKPLLLALAGAEARRQEKQVRDLPAGKYHLRIHLERAEVFALTLR